MPLPEGPVVGTCGFSYLEWRGRFYPPELPQTEWLRFYAQVFEAVELDGTFYRPPERSVVAAWAAALPDRFALAAKVPRAITHEARLEDEPAAAMLRAFARSLEPLGDRLLAVVLQLPPSLDERREVFRAMSKEEAPDMRDIIDGLLVFTYGGMYSEWTGYDRGTGRLERPAAWDHVGYGGPSDGHPQYREDV